MDRYDGIMRGNGSLRGQLNPASPLLPRGLGPHPNLTVTHLLLQRIPPDLSHPTEIKIVDYLEFFPSLPSYSSFPLPSHSVETGDPPLGPKFHSQF